MLFNAINENDESDMSQVVPPSSSYHHHPPRVGEGELTFSLADSFLPVTYDVNGTYTENWLQSPSAGTSWSFQPESAYESDTFVPPPRHNPQQQQSQQQQQQQQQLREEPILYTQPARQQYPQYEQYDSGPSVFVARNQHPRASSSASSSAQGISSHGSNYQFQTPVTQQRHPSFQTIPSPPLTQTQNLSHNQYDQPACQSINAAAWATTYSTDYDESVPGTRMPSHTSPPQATFKQILPQFVDESKNLYATGTKRAELQTPEPAKKRSRLVTPEPDINEFVVVFETAPGALANVKRRRKLDAPVRKAAKEVRKAGACHQCRFRRRTCSTGTPCGSCLKNGNGLHEIKCQRESPFVGKMMHQYFEHSSKRRVVSFNLRAGQLNPGADAIKHTVTIDGVGRLSHPVDIPALSQLFGSFSLDEKDTIKQTKELKPAEAADKDIDAESVLILEDGFAVALEQWAIEYSSKFVHAAGPEFYSTTMAQILGTAYVKKGLPESELVAAMLRMASLAFVLRAGVKYSYKGSTQCQFRTVQATVDTILFQRLRLAEKDLFQMLQRLIFRSAGSLTRDQIYPVALVLWQLLRILSIASSHLLNISQRFQSSAASKPADYQLFGLKLVISTHLALFRSSNPLLLDMNDKFNQDLLQNDEELIKLAVEMRKVVVNFKDKGFPEMKGSIAYRKDIFDQFRQVYSGK